MGVPRSGSRADSCRPVLFGAKDVRAQVEPADASSALNRYDVLGWDFLDVPNPVTDGLLRYADGGSQGPLAACGIDRAL